MIETSFGNIRQFICCILLILYNNEQSDIRLYVIILILVGLAGLEPATCRL